MAGPGCLLQENSPSDHTPAVAGVWLSISLLGGGCVVVRKNETQCWQLPGSKKHPNAWCHECCMNQKQHSWRQAFGHFWILAIASVKLPYLAATQQPTKRGVDSCLERQANDHTPAAVGVWSYEQHENPSSPHIDTRPVVTGMTYEEPPKQESAQHEKHNGVWPWSETRYHTPTMVGSNLHEHTEPNPMTPNPQNECPPNENLLYEHHPPNRNLPNKEPPNTDHQTEARCTKTPHTHYGVCGSIYGYRPEAAK
ncbi:hypothetical protein BS47DRAFT_1358941 [Hydnum rufescens UP504]|uniref:Uncharacterized protein n=1 Tax=Hydnum rufescens UP504 TaxID=1448309 RepID=A0A9P6B8Y4_9AGAM|nr:hypothetical protein BS47DRAFT_1358941 [Hydnum rufescens UP504]